MQRIPRRLHNCTLSPLYHRATNYSHVCALSLPPPHLRCHTQVSRSCSTLGLSTSLNPTPHNEAPREWHFVRAMWGNGWAMWCEMFACTCISSAICTKFHAHAFLLHSTHHIEDPYEEFFRNMATEICLSRCFTPFCLRFAHGYLRTNWWLYFAVKCLGGFLS